MQSIPVYNLFQVCSLSVKHLCHLKKEKYAFFEIVAERSVTVYQLDRSDAGLIFSRADGSSVVSPATAFEEQVEEWARNGTRCTQAFFFNT